MTSNWYILYGFNYKEHVKNFLDLPKYIDEESIQTPGYYGEKHLGLIHIDLDDIDPGQLFEACPDATNYNYFVFWEVGIPYAKGFGFFDMSDENGNERNRSSA